jgi:hypothetical protein
MNRCGVGVLGIVTIVSPFTKVQVKENARPAWNTGITEREKS